MTALAAPATRPGGIVSLRFVRVSLCGGDQPVAYRTLAAQDAPAGEHPILMLHGLGGSSNTWLRTLRWLSARPSPPVFAPDLPGCGQSHCPGDAPGMEALAEWAVRFLDTLGVERAHVAANSMGCQVALALADRFPERVGAVVLVGPTVGGRTVPFWRYFCGALCDALCEPSLLRLFAVRLFFRMGWRHYWQTARAMMEDDALARAPTIAAPCLVIRSAQDRIIPRRTALTLARTLPRGEYRALAGPSHMVPFTRPTAFGEALLDFCTRADDQL